MSSNESRRSNDRDIESQESGEFGDFEFEIEIPWTLELVRRTRKKLKDLINLTQWQMNCAL